MPVIAYNLVNPETGKTFKEENLELTWNISLNTRVRVKSTYDPESSSYKEGPHDMVLNVVKRGRDCDGTPLYWLSHLSVKEYESQTKLLEGSVMTLRDPETGSTLRLRGEIFGPPLDGGYSEDSLTVVALPDQWDHDV